VALCAWLAAAPGLAQQRAQEPDAAPILGRWLTGMGDGIVDITREADGSFQGRIIGGRAPARLDVHNPEPQRRSQPLLGQVILQGMRAAGDDSWSGGSIYDPDSGRTYHCAIELLDPNRLKLRGYLGVPMLGRSQIWTRYLGSSLELSPLRP